MSKPWLALALALASSTALASQYALEQAHAIIPAADAQKLRRAGLRTTLDLLTYGRTADGRRAIAARSGLAPERIAEWAGLADLMRVRGIGPDVARLLAAVGVRCLADLQRADPASTAAAVKDVNKARKLSTNPPGIESIAYWIDQARGLPVVYEP